MLLRLDDKDTLINLAVQMHWRPRSRDAKTSSLTMQNTTTKAMKDMLMTSGNVPRVKVPLKLRNMFFFVVLMQH